MPDNVHFSSKTDEHYTPRVVLDCVEKLFTVDLDPCAGSGDLVDAQRRFTKEQDGLQHAWEGTVYMNPPYGRMIGRWVDKLLFEYTQGNVLEAVALLPSRTDTKWFKSLKKYPHCFIWGRLRFGGSINAAPFPSMAVYVGLRTQQFVKAFGTLGDVYVWAGD